MHRRPQSQAFCPISPEPCKFEYFKSAKTHAFPRDSEFFTGDQIGVEWHPIAPGKPIAFNPSWAKAGGHVTTTHYGSGLGDRTYMAVVITEGLASLTVDQALGKLNEARLAITLVHYGIAQELSITLFSYLN